MSKEDWVHRDEEILNGKAKTRSKSGEINDPTWEDQLLPYYLVVLLN